MIWIFQSDWLIGLEKILVILDNLGWYCDVTNVFIRQPISRMTNFTGWPSLFKLSFHKYELMLILWQQHLWKFVTLSIYYINCYFLRPNFCFSQAFGKDIKLDLFALCQCPTSEVRHPTDGFDLTTFKSYQLPIYVLLFIF